MSATKRKDNLMVTLYDGEMQQLKKLSDTLGLSKSRTVAQALNLLAAELILPGMAQKIDALDAEIDREDTKNGLC